MCSWFCYEHSRRPDRRKIWRYPGVPIPFRLQSKYRNANEKRR